MPLRGFQGTQSIGLKLPSNFLISGEIRLYDIRSTNAAQRVPSHGHFSLKNRGF